jgi:endonuclease III
MKKVDIKILEANGWTVECESPLEIRHEESESFATGTAAYFVLDALVSSKDREDRLIKEIAEDFVKFVNEYMSVEEVNRNTMDTIISQFDFGRLKTYSIQELIATIYNILKEKGVV